MNEPKHTCPDIDEGIDEIQQFAKDLTAFTETFGFMENLRKGNEALRDYGNHWKEVAEEFEGELEVVRSENEEMEDKISTLEQKIEELEAQIKEQDGDR